MTYKKIIIGIPTYKRPAGLRRLLESIEKINVLQDLNIHLVIADNEGEGCGTNLVKEMVENGYKYPLSIVPVYERGISQARNALLNEGFKNHGADFLVMVDDDEHVDPDWLSSLLEMQKQTGADVVSGMVLAEFEIPPPFWTKSLKVYHRHKGKKSGIVDMVHSTTSVLLSRSLLSLENFIMEFDHSFALSGGEDEEFFKRVSLAGGKFAFSTQAISYEVFPASRTTRRWAVKRAFRIGTTHIRMAKRYPPPCLP